MYLINSAWWWTVESIYYYLSTACEKIIGLGKINYVYFGQTWLQRIMHENAINNLKQKQNFLNGLLSNMTQPQIIQ